MLVLEVAENYGAKLLQGKPTALTVHYLANGQESRSFHWQLMTELHAYSRTIANHRMMMRGIDEKLLHPLDVVTNDLADFEKVRKAFSTAC